MSLAKKSTCTLSDQTPVGDPVASQEDTLQHLAQLHERYGNIVRFSKKVHLVFGLEEIKHILRLTNKNFFVQSRLGLITREESSESSFSADEVAQTVADWKKPRSGLIKGLHHSRVERFAASMQELINKELAECPTGQSIDLVKMLQRVNSHSIVHYFFGSRGETLIPHINAMIEAHFNFFDGLFSLPGWIPSLKKMRLRTRVQRLNLALHDIILQHRQHPPQQEDLLTTLLATRTADEQPLDDDFICDTLRTAFFQSAFPPVATLSWLWYLLGQHPEQAKKCYQEIDEVLGKRAPTPSDRAQLPYLDAVIKETLRLYPPVWQLRREVAVNCEVDGYTYANGQRLRLVPYYVHRNASYFEHPNNFLPERWLDEQVSKKMASAYLPFGAGPMQCIGAPLALMEIFLVSVSLAQRYHVQIAPHPKLKIALAMVLRPKTLTVVLRARPGV